MSKDIFLRVDGITGESKDARHPGWIQVESFGWGATQPSAIEVGSGGGAGKVKFRDLTVNAFIDKATPNLLRYVSNGKHINSVELSSCKAGGEQLEYFKINLKQVMVTDVVFNGATGQDLFGVTYCFRAAEVSNHYFEQTTEGARGAEFSSGWSIKENKEL
ncbi:type VI secretion system tube protein Hcp [Erwinia aphidicola]|jgi:type VI secretion system secreted protein Hcp|uniref:Type VI secretion system tube protein Hcp n=1 Tax=Erwinia aphidicola TaxID=68334 RepID=A0ABU8DKN6_ERWAP|nr:type VI secretion system tube protein Hcp [Erwinia aphidicola]MBD1375475.1 type VI secretion system tube protein Hcp [Erwinia aphidicola]PIJ60302.1 hypothetical protein BOM23_00175 [Erwinia sp. OLMDLW33]